MFVEFVLVDCLAVQSGTKLIEDGMDEILYIKPPKSMGNYKYGIITNDFN